LTPKSAFSEKKNQIKVFTGFGVFLTQNQAFSK